MWISSQRCLSKTTLSNEKWLSSRPLIPFTCQTTTELGGYKTSMCSVILAACWERKVWYHGIKICFPVIIDERFGYDSKMIYLCYYQALSGKYFYLDTIMHNNDIHGYTSEVCFMNSDIRGSYIITSINNSILQNVWFLQLYNI